MDTPRFLDIIVTMNDDITFEFNFKWSYDSDADIHVCGPLYFVHVVDGMLEPSMYNLYHI